MEAECGKMDNGDSEKYGGGREMDDGRLLSGYNVHRSRCTEGPNFTTVQYTNVAKLHLYSMIIYKYMYIN